MIPVIKRPFGSIYQSWKLAKLPEYVFFQEGPGLRNWQWTDAGMKVINVKNILPDGSIDLSNSDRYISLEEFEQRYSHFAVEDSDIVVASSGSYGKVGRIYAHHLPLMMNTSVIRFRPASAESLDPNYLFAFLRSNLFHNQVESLVTGSVQKNFGPSHLQLMEIPVPPLSTQCKIAAVLSTYDDLIENNTRRIKILEEMAQAIYREWFVEFRFSGHEGVQMVESELGLIPQGWKVRGLGDLCKVVPGFAFKSKDWQDTGVGVVKIKNIQSDNTIDIQDMDCVSSDILSPKLDKYRLVNGDFLIAMTGATAGKVGRLRTKTTMMLNQRVAKLDPIDVYRDYIWCKISMAETQNAFFRLADGAAQPNMSGSQIENYRTVCPPQSVCNHFSSVVAEMLIQTDNLMLRNANLRQTRDLLLPKLISGEIDVSELHIDADRYHSQKGE